MSIQIPDKIEGRLCYENGNAVSGKKVYEFYRRCSCEKCMERYRRKREPRNQATATTKDETKRTEVVEFLKNWSCADGDKWLPIAYFTF